MKTKDRIPGLRVSIVRDAPLPKEHTVVDCARTAAQVARGFILAGDEREHFLAILLDARKNVKGVVVVSIGTISASLVHPREFFRPAIVGGAALVVAVHNHPSGDPEPSSEDKEVTRRLQRAGEIIGIPLADHVVLGAGEAFFSFRERGLI